MRSQVAIGRGFRGENQVVGLGCRSRRTGNRADRVKHFICIRPALRRTLVVPPSPQSLSAGFPLRPARRPGVGPPRDTKPRGPATAGLSLAVRRAQKERETQSASLSVPSLHSLSDQPASLSSPGYKRPGGAKAEVTGSMLARGKSLISCHARTKCSPPNRRCQGVYRFRRVNHEAGLIRKTRAVPLRATRAAGVERERILLKGLQANSLSWHMDYGG